MLAGRDEGRRGVDEILMVEGVCRLAREGVGSVKIGEMVTKAFEWWKRAEPEQKQAFLASLQDMGGGSEMRLPTLAAMGYKTTERVESLRKDGHRLEVCVDGSGHATVMCRCARCEAERVFAEHAKELAADAECVELGAMCACEVCAAIHIRRHQEEEL